MPLILSESITPEELGKQLGKTPAAVKKMFQRHKLPGYQIDRYTLRFMPDEINAHLSKKRQPAGGAK
jgi:biotin operon repressor